MTKEDGESRMANSSFCHCIFTSPRLHASILSIPCFHIKLDEVWYFPTSLSNIGNLRNQGKFSKQAKVGKLQSVQLQEFIPSDSNWLSFSIPCHSYINLLIPNILSSSIESKASSVRSESQWKEGYSWVIFCCITKHTKICILKQILIILWVCG